VLSDGKKIKCNKNESKRKVCDMDDNRNKGSKEIKRKEPNRNVIGVCVVPVPRSWLPGPRSAHRTPRPC
jgi:hypothetical protein